MGQILRQPREVLIITLKQAARLARMTPLERDRVAAVTANLIALLSWKHGGMKGPRPEMLPVSPRQS